MAHISPKGHTLNLAGHMSILKNPKPGLRGSMLIWNVRPEKTSADQMLGWSWPGLMEPIPGLGRSLLGRNRPMVGQYAHYRLVDT